MPIYAYKCGSCGHAKDVLQKISDAPQTQCPACNAQAWSKQLSAPGFQLKGTGWYATDFKNAGASTNLVATDTEPAKPGADAQPSAPSAAQGGANTSAGVDSAGASAPNGASASAPVSTGEANSSSSSSSSGGCGASCACH